MWIRETTTSVKVPTNTYGKIPSLTIERRGCEHREIPDLITPTHNPFTSGGTLIHRHFHNGTTVKNPDAKIVESHQVTRQDFEMPMLCLTDEQVMHLVQQLPAVSKKRVLRNLIAERDTWLTADAPDELQMRLFAGARGLDWDGLSEVARDQVIDDLLHEP